MKALLQDQPFVPKYFPFDVELNKTGARILAESIGKIRFINVTDYSDLDQQTIIVDTRTGEKFNAGHLPNSINLQTNGKFETWLGSIISPGEAFYLTAENESSLQEMIGRTAKIGYEKFVKAAFVASFMPVKTALLDVERFKTESAGLPDYRCPQYKRSCRKNNFQ